MTWEKLRWKLFGAACFLFGTYSYLVILNVWCLVPGDPTASKSQVLMSKILMSVLFIAIGYGSCRIGKRSFKKSRFENTKLEVQR